MSKKKEYETIILPASIVEEAAAACDDDPDNGFRRCLTAADEFRRAGLTPIFILDPDNMDLVVVVKETYNKLLN